MNATAPIKSTLDSFFAEKEFSVLVLRGAWGIGKTYFWETYIEDRIDREEIEQTAYSYISLFGLHDLSELKSKIFREGQLLKTKKEFEQEIKESSKKKNRVFQSLLEMGSNGQNFLRALGPITRLAKVLPYSKDFASIIELTEFVLVENYLICIDDIERKEDDLTIKQIMGFVDEASKRKKCKFILILNEKTLEKHDLEEFDKYREKIVDLEIEYKPTVEENLLKVFQPSELYLEDIKNVFQSLKTSNIRIFKKLKWSIEKIRPFIKNTEPVLQTELIVHLSVFCWGFFNSENSLSLAFISDSIKDTTWLSISSKHQNETQEEKEWNQVANTLELFSAGYDDCLVSMLTDGFLDEDDFVEKTEKANQEARANFVQKMLHRAWNIYTDSFADNVDNLKALVRAVLDNHLSEISLWDFSQSIDLLEEFGDNVESYIDSYVSRNSQNLTDINFEDFSGLRKIKNSTLERKIQQLRNSSEGCINIDSVLDSIIQKQGFGHEEVDFLSSCTEQEIYEWMMSNPNRIVAKIRQGLFFFRGLNSSNEKEKQKYKAITDNTIGALKRVARQNLLNQKRVKFIYGIDPSDDE